VALSAVSLTQNRRSLFAQWSRSAGKKEKLSKLTCVPWRCVTIRNAFALANHRASRIAQGLHKVSASPKTELEISAAKP